LKKNNLTILTGLLILINIFTLLNVNEVESSSLTVNVTTSSSDYKYNSFNPDDMPVRMKFDFTITGTLDSPLTWVSIQSPQGYILAAEGLQPTLDDFIINDVNSTADGIQIGSTMAYDCNISSPGNYTIYVDVINCLPFQSSQWRIQTYGGGLNPPYFLDTFSDNSPPFFIVQYIKTPKIDYNVTPDVLGAGELIVRIRSYERLAESPIIKLKSNNVSEWTTLSVEPGNDSTLYYATYEIPSNPEYNGLALLTIQGRDTAGNIGTGIQKSGFYFDPFGYIISDGNSFYIDTVCDSPSLYYPTDGETIFGNRNEANFTFYRISDLSAERPADPAQNNCITYNLQYSTSSDFSTNVVTQSVDIDEANDIKYFCEPLMSSTTYNNWDLVWAGKPFNTLRRYRSSSLSNGTWYWRVYATDKLGNQSPYSEVRSFKVSNSNTELIAPTDISTLKYKNPILSWRKVPSATSYDLRLSRENPEFLDYTSYPNKIAVNNYTSDYNPLTFEIIEYNVSVSTPPIPVIGTLEDGLWYWKVSSNLDSSSYSETWRFIVDTTGPEKPIIDSPYNNETTQNAKPVFNWFEVSDINNLSEPVKYYIQISGNSNFPNAPGPANVSFSGTTIWRSAFDFSLWQTTTYQNGPLSNTTFVPLLDLPSSSTESYYWRVYAVDAAGNQGPYSNFNKFMIATPLIKWGTDPDGSPNLCESYPDSCETNEAATDYLALQLKSPISGSTVSTKTPKLEWKNSECPCVMSNISGYIIQYSSDISFSPSKTKEILGVAEDNESLSNKFVINSSYHLADIEYTIEEDLGEGTYYWRVSIIDTLGGRYQFTQPWNFTVNTSITDQNTYLGKIGLYYPLDGYWIFSANEILTQEPSLGKTFYFGNSNYIPILGDWDGDGIDEPAIYSNGYWIFTTKDPLTQEPTVDRSFWFGTSSFLPVVGDWDGDGIDEPAIYSNGYWIFTTKDPLTQEPTVDRSFWFGNQNFNFLVHNS